MWEVGDRIPVPAPDDPRWELVFHRFREINVICIGGFDGISVRLHQDVLYIADMEVPGFKAWRYAKHVRKMFRTKGSRANLQKQRDIALKILEECP
jgi:hypothetical protein